MRLSPNFLKGVADERQHPPPVHDSEPQEDGRRRNHLSGCWSIIAGAHRFHLPVWSPIKGKDIDTGYQDKSNLQNKRDVVFVLVGITRKEERPGDEINDEAC